jgi:hypothetical protein
MEEIVLRSKCITEGLVAAEDGIVTDVEDARVDEEGGGVGIERDVVNVEK